MKLYDWVVPKYLPLFVGISITLAMPSQALAQRKRVTKKVVKIDRVKRVVQQPKRGVRVRTLPKGARPITFRTFSYYLHKGIFYQSVNNYFVVVRPPVGLRISTLPVGFRPIRLQGRRYFYYYGTFYLEVGKEYEVVTPPLGALVESIPDGYEEVHLDGETYFTGDGIQYKAVLHEGAIWYEVIKVD